NATVAGKERSDVPSPTSEAATHWGDSEEPATSGLAGLLERYGSSPSKAQETLDLHVEAAPPSSEIHLLQFSPGFQGHQVNDSCDGSLSVTNGLQEFARH